MYVCLFSAAFPIGHVMHTRSEVTKDVIFVEKGPLLKIIQMKSSRLKSLVLQWVYWVKLFLLHRGVLIVACRKVVFEGTLFEWVFLSASLSALAFLKTWLKGKNFSSERFLFLLLWCCYLNRKRLLVLFDIIEFSFDIFLRLLDPQATVRARLRRKKNTL